MAPKILTLDIETQRAVAEVFDLWPNYIPHDKIKVPKRVLCFAAKWYGDDRTIFKAAWKDGDTVAYERMVRAAWDLFDQADFIVGWNSKRFDVQHFQAAFGRLGLGMPSPARQIDLMMVAKKNFKAGEMSLKLDWFSQHWLGDRKIKHNGTDLWWDIRNGTYTERMAAQKLMREYNIHDVSLTERLFDRFKPWIGENFALYDPESEGAMVCTKCSSENLVRKGFFFTTAFKYQRYRCKDCGSWNKGKRMVYTTELRPV